MIFTAALLGSFFVGDRQGRPGTTPEGPYGLGGADRRAGLVGDINQGVRDVVGLHRGGRVDVAATL